MKKFSVFLFCFLCLVPAVRADGLKPPFSEEDKKLLDDIETYFNSVKTIKSNFSQVSGNGAFAEGTLVLSKPGKMRLEYAPPHPVEIIADGKNLIFHDKKLEQVTYLDLNENPASIILQNDFSFKNLKLTVESVNKSNGFAEVTVFKTAEPALGKITLVFKDRPLTLKQWQVVDAQQAKTLVSLNQTEFNVPVDETRFAFKNPYKTAVRPGDRQRRER